MPDVPYPTYQEPQAQNPLQTMQGLTALYSATQEVRARDAIGQIFQQSIGDDGKPDYAKAMTLMAGNPAAAWKLPEIAGQIAQRNLTEAHTTQVNLGNAAAQAGFLGQKAYALALDQGSNVTMRDVAGVLTEGVTQGLYEPKDATAALASLGSKALKGQALADYLKSYGLQQQSLAQQHSIALEGFKTAFEPIITRDPVTGQEVARPRYQMFGVAPPGLPRTMGGGVPGGAPSAPGGAPGAGLGGSSQPPDSPPQNPALSPQGNAGVPVGPTAMQSAGLGQMAEYQKEAAHEADQANTQLMQIQQARALLKQFNSGPSRETFAQAAHLASSFGFQNLADRLSGGGPGAMAALQDFEKFSVGMAANMAQASVGSRVTNFQEQTFLKANANKGLLNEANEKLFDFAQKMAEYRQNKMEALQAYVRSGGDPVQFPVKWQNSMRKAGHFDRLSGTLAATGLQFPGEPNK